MRTDMLYDTTRHDTTRHKKTSLTRYPRVSQSVSRLSWRISQPVDASHFLAKITQDITRHAATNPGGAPLLSSFTFEIWSQKLFFFYNPIILARPYRTLVGMAWAEVTITDRGFARTPNPGLPRLQPSKLFWNPASGACALRTEPPEMMIKRSCCARRVLQ
jgi:hypothetical protein